MGLAITALLLTGTAPAVRSQTALVYPISVTASTEDHTTHGAGIPNTTAKPETRTEKLFISLQNTTQQNYSNLTVRYCIFDKDVQSQKIAVALQHELPINLPSLAALILTSQVASITYTPNHEKITKPKPTKKGETETVKETPVKAAGKEFAGYGVEVRQSTLAVGQLFSSLDRTNQFTKAFSGTKRNP